MEDFKMKKNKLLKVVTMAMAICMVFCAMSVTSFAADASLVNSVGSVEADADLENGTTAQTVVGIDKTQEKQSEYHTVELEEEAQDIACDVYATQAAGEDVYDPTNPDADPDGFVDGSVQALLPKTVILNGKSEEITVDGNTYQSNVGKYVVAVKGNISGDSYIKVAPSASFKMSTNGKDDIDANINQPIQKFYVADSTLDGLNDDCVKSVTTSFEDSVQLGTIYTLEPITAGKWNAIDDAAPVFAIQLTYIK
jgi:hypothetical protein